MATQQSPGVRITERNASLRIPSVTSSTGAIVVAATKGPINVPIQIKDEANYVEVFGKPDDVNYKHFFTAAAFLGGSNSLYVVRTEDVDKLVAGTTVGLSGSDLAILPTPIAAGEFPLSYDNMSPHEAVDGNVDLLDTEIYHAFGIGAGPYYDDIGISCVTANDYNLLVQFKEQLAQAVSLEDIAEIAETWYTGTPPTTAQYNPSYENYLSDKPLLRDELIDPTDWSVNTGLLASYCSFEFGPQIKYESDGVTPLGALLQDELAVYVFDENDNLVEQYVVSKDPSSKDGNGNNNFGPSVINATSGYIYFFIADSPEASLGTILYSTGKFLLMGADPLTTDLSLLTGEISEQWFANFINKEDITIDILLDPDYNDDLKRTLDYIASQIRKDCIALLNIPANKMFNITTGKIIANAYTTMKRYVDGTDPVNTLNINSSYSAIYGNYFKIFDKYNEVNRWVPATGYVGQIIANVDFNQAQWWAPAGLNRGIISNLIDIAIKPDLAQRDVLYSNRINPIVNFNGQGITIWGQKTLTGIPGAFDRINVRRLFLFLERSIEAFARFLVFEFNDNFTRSRFTSSVNGFLAGIKAKRGVTDFEVVCDTRNNTAEIIDANQFVAEILIKPARAAEFITLAFTAVSTGVSFTEIVGN
jgi:phage tail sheath protein FI